jgi:flagellar biosynthesis/type III secretory pathway ATPase
MALADNTLTGRACMIADACAASNRRYTGGDPTGRLVGASGLLLESAGCRLHTGQRCQIETVNGEWLDAQVVGFREKLSYLMPFKKATG